MFKIYQIVNTINNSKYIGYTSVTVEKRFEKHLRDAKRPACSSHILYKAFNKYGIQNFKCEEIESIELKEIATQREQHWIAFLKTNRLKHPNDGGYNMNDGGMGGTGYKHTKESLQLMRAYALNKKHTEESKQKISKANKGKPKSKFQKQRASETHNGKTLSPDHIKALSTAMLLRNKNRTPTQDKAFRKKLSERAPTSRKVNQYTLDGTLIASFNQIKLAAASVGLSNVAISNACKGLWKTAGGFIWKFVV